MAINGEVYGTIKSAVEGVRRRFGEIGECESVQRQGREEMEWLVGLLSRHPVAEEKLAGMRNLRAGRSRLNKKAWEVTVVKEDGRIVDMSWQQSIRGRDPDEKARLKKAMRKAVFEEQIRVFRNSTDTRKCGLCREGIVGGRCIGGPLSANVCGAGEGLHGVEGGGDTERICGQQRLPDMLQRGGPRKEDHRKEAGLRILCVECNRWAHLA